MGTCFFMGGGGAQVSLCPVHLVHVKHDFFVGGRGGGHMAPCPSPPPPPRSWVMGFLKVVKEKNQDNEVVLSWFLFENVHPTQLGPCIIPGWGARPCICCELKKKENMVIGDQLREMPPCMPPPPPPGATSACYTKH